MNKRIRKKWKCRNNFRHYSTYNELIKRSGWHFVKHVMFHDGKTKPRYRQLKKEYMRKPFWGHADIAQKPDSYDIGSWYW